MSPELNPDGTPYSPGDTKLDAEALELAEELDRRYRRVQKVRAARATSQAQGEGGELFFPFAPPRAGKQS